MTRASRLRLIVADDEPLARDLVRQYVAGHPDVLVAGECRDAHELRHALDAIDADVLLLDIRMPGPSVFEVLASSSAGGRSLPAVIFATAYDNYAVRAFEMNAVDYLVKPFSADRLAEALARARSRQAPDRAASLTRVIRDLGPRPDRLLVPDGRRMVPVGVADIVYIKAEDDYARVFANGRNYLVGRSLKDLEGRLDPARFVRIHRSVIVHLAHLREVAPQGGSRYRLGLSDGTAVIVSRARGAELRKLKL
jgi:two-component system LytT family response regulator